MGDSAENVPEGSALPSSASDTVAKPPDIGVDDDGTMFVMTADGAAACFYRGEWHPGIIFEKIYTYAKVTDPEEIKDIMAQAASALQMFLDMHKS